MAFVVHKRDIIVSSTQLCTQLKSNFQTVPGITVPLHTANERQLKQENGEVHDAAVSENTQERGYVDKGCNSRRGRQ